METYRVSTRSKYKFGPRRLNAPLPLMPVLPLGFLATDEIQIRHQNTQSSFYLMLCASSQKSYMYLSRSGGSDLKEERKSELIYQTFLSSKLEGIDGNKCVLNNKPIHMVRVITPGYVGGLVNVKLDLKDGRACVMKYQTSTGFFFFLTHSIMSGAGKYLPWDFLLWNRETNDFAALVV